MEDFYINSTSVDKSYKNSNESNDETGISNIMKLVFIRDVVLCIIASIGLPLTLVAIYQLYSLVRKDHVAPIYIINLLISDLIQLCSMIVFVAKPQNFIIREILHFTYIYGLMASICFMVCIALERYLVVAWPLWYRFRRTIKTSVVVCVVVWILLLVTGLFFYFVTSSYFRRIIYALIFLLSLPLFIFFLFGTIKALSAAISVPPDEKRRIVAILVLVLIIYTLLFLPTIIRFLAGEERSDAIFWFVSDLLLKFSPLTDLFLYFFSRKGAVDKLLALVCRCRMNIESDVSRTRMNDNTPAAFC